MKWSTEQTTRLKELCMEEKSNKDIAEFFGAPVAEIHAKRSQLGITIPAVKEIKQAQADPLREKRAFVRSLLPAFRAANSTILDLDLTSAGRTVTITHTNGSARIVNIEADSYMAIIYDLANRLRSL